MHRTPKEANGRHYGQRSMLSSCCRRKGVVNKDVARRIQSDSDE
jgi:hypothetical protein